MVGVKIEYSRHAEKRLAERGITKAQVEEVFSGGYTTIEHAKDEFTVWGSDSKGVRIKIGYIAKPDGAYFIRTVASPDKPNSDPQGRKP